MKLEDRARELLGNIEECSEQFVRTAKQEDEFIVPMIADTLRQVAREERERNCKAVCKRCNDGAPVPFEPHFPWVHQVGMDNYKCDAAAIRSLEDV